MVSNVFPSRPVEDQYNCCVLTSVGQLQNFAHLFICLNECFALSFCIFPCLASSILLQTSIQWRHQPQPFPPEPSDMPTPAILAIARDDRRAPTRRLGSLGNMVYANGSMPHPSPIASSPIGLYH
ncbi:unnamed protein product [Protopolystoma xenopodis]|uniref:Uncharacterized protein n=1 Tax=Protopolystoma xenopodis TaxID=117903 RepID=A0A448WHK6_9PLAT|nr:unnamed protein product [Protopolystoma xenopodis]